MVEDRIGYRYAKSAFSLAQEQKDLDNVHTDMKMISDLCQENGEFVAMLQSPIIGGTKKQEVLNAIFDGKYQTKLVPLLIEMIVKKGREAFLPNVAHSFMEMYDEAKGILRGVLTSATELPAATIAEIKANLEKSSGRSFEFTTEVNPDLIGGFTLKVGDTLFDGSIGASLRRLKQELT